MTSDYAYSLTDREAADPFRQSSRYAGSRRTIHRRTASEVAADESARADAAEAELERLRAILAAEYDPEPAAEPWEVAEWLDSTPPDGLEYPPEAPEPVECQWIDVPADRITNESKPQAWKGRRLRLSRR